MSTRCFVTQFLVRMHLGKAASREELVSGLARGPGHSLVHVFNTCPLSGVGVHVCNRNPDGNSRNEGVTKRLRI